MVEGGVDEDGSGRGLLFGGNHVGGRLEDGTGTRGGGNDDGRAGAGAGWIRGGDEDGMDGSKENF